MSRPDSWMPLYIGDYLADTMHLTAEQSGGYLYLIMHYWRTGAALEDSDAKLSAIARMNARQWRANKDTIKAFFKVSNGVWSHNRIEVELKEAHEKYERLIERSRKGVLARNSKENLRHHNKDNPRFDDKPTQPQPQSKKESAPSEASPLALERSFWKTSKEFLVARGAAKDVAAAGGLVGKWLKAIGPPDSKAILLRILASAEANAQGDVIAYIETAIRSEKRGKPNQTEHRRAGLAGAFAERFGSGQGEDPSDRPEGTHGEARALPGPVEPAGELERDSELLS